MSHDELDKSIKVVETIGIQKKALEYENDELRSRISELINERENTNANTRKRLTDSEASQTFNSGFQTVPPLNLGKNQGGRASGRKF